MTVRDEQLKKLLRERKKWRRRSKKKKKTISRAKSSLNTLAYFVSYKNKNTFSFYFVLIVCPFLLFSLFWQFRIITWRKAFHTIKDIRNMFGDDYSLRLWWLCAVWLITSNDWRYFLTLQQQHRHHALRSSSLMDKRWIVKILECVCSFNRI